MQKMVGTIRHRVNATEASVEGWGKIGIGMPTKEQARLENGQTMDVRVRLCHQEILCLIIYTS